MAVETVKSVTGRKSKAIGWGLGVTAAVLAAIGLVLLFLLTLSTNNRALYERNYAWLFGLNVFVAVLLFAVLVWVALRLRSRLKRGKFGSRLLIKLTAIFALAGLVPGVLIYVVSYQFVARSIDSWFDVKVESALNAGVSLARVTFETLADDVGGTAKTASVQLVNVSDASAGLVLSRMRDQLGALDVVLWNASARPVASAGQSIFDISPERPSLAMLRGVRPQRASTVIEGLDDIADAASQRRVKVKAFALVPSPRVGLLAEPRYLQITMLLPAILVENAVAVQNANREYQERSFARAGLRRMYIGTLTLSLFLAVFGAVLLAVVLGNQIARPLLVLAEGVREVAEGNLSPKSALTGNDELGGLTRSFALMTQQIADARAAVESSMRDVEASRANLQTILDNLTAGVVVLNEAGAVVSSNPGATRILRVPMAVYEGRLLKEIDGLAQFGEAIEQHFSAFLEERSQHDLDHWQHSFELDVKPSSELQHGISLVVRGAELPQQLRLVVFDDVSDMVSAQRAQAWGEVARRLAHEIKNPLTPIQLSAERLAMKLQDKLQPNETVILAKSVKTIVDQVDALKRLVNEFRDYARLPTAELKAVNLNGLITDLLQLYSPENAAVAIRADLDPHAQPILGDDQQLRQVIHNLLQNAQDATLQAVSERAAVDGGTIPFVCISTRYSAENGRVRLVGSDSGSGFPEHILRRAFEPYVTTKPKGTGLGLAVVKKIADEHGARIDLANRIDAGRTIGAQVSLSFAMMKNSTA